ncbi:MAG: carboxypeptidase regulatory-like domain-containing protein [Chitinophagales bacterium]
MLFQTILILFFTGIVSVIIFLLRPINLKIYNLAVIGAVVDEDTQQPIVHAQVILEELNGSRQAKTLTHQDGGFWFTLQPTKKYRLLLVDENEVVIDEAHLSTLSIESKTFDVVLRGAGNNTLPYRLAS